MANKSHYPPTVPLPPGGIDEHSTRAQTPDTSRVEFGDSGAVPTAALRELRSLLDAPETEGFEESATGNELADYAQQPAINGYKIGGVLGQGGMGAVFQARDLRLHRDVAIKVLRGDHVGREDLQARFIAEAQIHAQLQHPGVAPLHAQGEAADGRPYFAMKVVQGRTLAELLRERTDPADDRPRFLKIFEQICQTLAYAHARRVIHRDLKPGNVMVGAFGEVQVMDWGLAKVLTDDAAPPAHENNGATAGQAAPLRTLRSQDSNDAFATRAAVGTLAYMPPEQAQGDTRRVDERADVFGLGAILTEILTGAPPYQHDSTARMLQRAVGGRLDSAYARLDASGADAELIQLAKHCLAPAPAERPRDAGIVSEQITHYLESAEARLRDAELARAASEVKAREERRRRKLLIGLGATFLIAAGAVVALVVGMVYQGKLQTANAELTSTNGQLRNTQGQLEQAQADLKRVTYFRLVSLATTDWRDDNGARALAVLADCPPALRHWEWYYLQRLMDSLVLRGHVGAVTCATFSPDGKHVVSGDTDGKLKVWNSVTGQELFTLEAHEGPARSAAFTPDGTKIVSGGRDYKVKIWDVETQQLLRTLEGHQYMVNSVAISPDGTKIVSGSRDYTLRIWDVVTGNLIRAIGSAEAKAHDFDVYCVAFSPDGKQIVSGGGDSLVKVWNVEDGRELRTLRGHVFDGAGGAFSVAFSPDGKTIVSGGRDNTMKVWDVASGELKTSISAHTGSVLSVSFSPEGEHLISASADRTLKVWDAATWANIAALKGHGNSVRSAAFSPDGKRIVSGSGDGTARIWDAEANRTSVHLAGHETFLETVAFSPDGSQLVSGGRDSVLNIWNLKTGKVDWTLKGHTAAISCAEYSPDGKFIASGGHDALVKTWDATTGVEIRTLTGHVGGVSCVRYSMDGTRIVSSGGIDDNKIIIWDAVTGERIQTIEGHATQILCVAFSPDGKRIVVGGGDGKASPHESSREAGFYSLKVFDVETGEVLLTLDGHLYIVRSADWSPDGKVIVSGSLDSKIRTWNADTGKEFRTLAGHADTVFSVKFSPDGRRIVSGGSDAVKVWDAATGDEAISFKEGAEGTMDVAISRDGKQIASCGANSIIRIWTAAGDWDGKPPAVPEAEDFPTD